MGKQYTVLVRQSKLEYVAVCLELNVAARGEDLADVERNLKSAIQMKLEDAEAHPETVVEPMPTEELIEFLRDTTPEWYEEGREGILLRPMEVHEVPSYA